MLDILSCPRYDSNGNYSEGNFRLWIYKDSDNYTLSTLLHLGKYNEFSFNIY